MKLKQSMPIVGMLILAGIVFVLVKNSAQRAEEKHNLQTSIRDSENNLKSQPTQKLPILIDLGRGICIQCKKMKPILEELKAEYEGKATIKIIDLTYEPEEANKYKIRLIPTQIFFDTEGNEVYRHEGFMDKQSIKQKLLEMGIK